MGHEILSEPPRGVTWVAQTGGAVPDIRTVDRTGIANLNHCFKHRKQITLLSVTQKQERKFTMEEDRRTKFKPAHWFNRPLTT